jgi:hypothetical protein
MWISGETGITGLLFPIAYTCQVWHTWQVYTLTFYLLPLFPRYILQRVYQKIPKLLHGFDVYFFIG